MREAQTRLLVVDDEPQLRRMLRRYLEGEGFLVREAEDLDGVRRALEAGIDLMTLDLKLRASDGLTIARTVRETSRVPIIIITAKAGMVDMVAGLELGADDYIAKPFHMREVLARIRSVLRRSRPSGLQDPDTTSPHIGFDGYRLDLDRRELSGPDGKLRGLTSGEFDLMVVFARHPNRVLDRDRIMDMLKGRDWAPTDRTIDNQVARLRKKIEEDPSHPRLLKTVRGAGYCFAPAEFHRS